MNAYMVEIRGQVGVYLIHANSAAQAKYRARQHMDLGLFEPEYTELRATRCPSLDNKPFTLENVETVLVFSDEDDDQFCARSEYENQCPCEICREKAHVK